MRIVFLGNDPWSVPSLEALASDPGFEVVSVITNPPKPAGRGSRLTPTAVADAARRLGLTLLEVEGVRTGPGHEAILGAAPDALVVVAYGELLSPEVLSAPRLGAVNVHFSLLPRWRGAAPVQHALLEGDTRTGVSVMLMDAGLDTGPILALEEMEILAEEDAGSLGARLAERGAGLLTRTLPAFASDAIVPASQDVEGAMPAPKLTAADRLVQWDHSAAQILARVRALAPEPGARTEFRGSSLKLLRVGTSDAADGRPAQPGTVVDVDDQGPLVVAGSGLVRLLWVAPAGRRRMSGTDWARGARIRSGERLG